MMAAFAAATNLAPTRALAAVQAGRGKRHRTRIFPPVGTSPDEGHGFGIHGADIQAPELLAFFESAPLGGMRLVTVT